MSAASAVRARRRRSGRASTRRIGVLFMIGSACFAVASIPGGSSATPRGVGITYFIGSIFFTIAAFEQLRTSELGDSADLWSSLIQFTGTLLFNVNTFNGSIAFGISAIASYVLPDKEALLDATVARTMTLLGAICFFTAAYTLSRLGTESGKAVAG